MVQVSMQHIYIMPRDTCRLHWLPVKSGQKRQPNKLHSSFRRSEAIWMRSLECWSETCKQRASKKSLLVPQCSWLPPLPMRRRCGWPSVCRSDLCLSWPHSHSLWHSCMKRRSSFRHVHIVWIDTLHGWSGKFMQPASRQLPRVLQCLWLLPLPMRRRCGKHFV